MNEKKLIGNILAEDEDEPPSRFLTKRYVLLNPREIEEIPRSASAPPDQALWSNVQDSESLLGLGREVFPSLFSQRVSVPPPGFEPVGLTESSPEFIPGLMTLPPDCLPGYAEPQDSRERLNLLAKDQTGSRFLQQQVEGCGEEERRSLLADILPLALDLMTDAFGNYVIQKLLENGDREQRRALADQMVGNVVALAMHMYGCRVVQKALDVIDLEQRRLLVRELRGLVEQCVDNQHANHVVQKAIEVLPFEDILFIIAALRPRSVYWVMHPYGCRVMQRILEFSPREMVMDVLDAILERVVEVSMEAYGNYVIQHILEKGHQLDRERLLRKVLSRVVDLSKHKFASNVVEKCLLCAPPAILGLLVGELYGPAAFELMTDKYANFVMQKAIEVSRGDLQTQALAKVAELSASLRTYTYGRHVLNAAEKVRKTKSPY